MYITNQTCRNPSIRNTEAEQKLDIRPNKEKHTRRHTDTHKKSETERRQKDLLHNQNQSWSGNWE